ncbi:protein anon-73B1 [Aethina tumida]|uniref:protein anon-73B1 n=1 Tax=Aethina tumida TaxID=116153 RepID=UPI00096AFDAA|nr:protein anon-73B1 [Aethina tumida]
MNSAINIGVEDMTSTVIQYGLYIAAFFQILCLGVTIFTNPVSTDYTIDYGRNDSDDDEGEHSSEQSTPQTSPRRPLHHRVRKPEKKKRR